MAKETVLITGASAGIGRELARLFAADQCELVLIARRQDRLEELAASLRGQYGVGVRIVPADLSQSESPQAIFEQLQSENRSIDVLVNNAGFGALGPFADLSLQEQLDMLQVNITTLTHLSRLFLPGMIERGRGGLLNVASTAGFQPGPFMAVYYASKAYVIALSEAIHDEVAGSGVGVTCFCPGPTLTEFATTARMSNAKMFKMAPMTAEQAARAGYRGFRKGRTMVVPGVLNNIGSFGVRFVPRSLSRGIARRLQWDK